MTTNLIETMARAICGEAGYDTLWDEFNPSEKETFTDCARAAISALEAAGYRVVPVEPTGEMVKAAWDCTVFTTPEQRMEYELLSRRAGHDRKTRCRYTAMLDAAPKASE